MMQMYREINKQIQIYRVLEVRLQKKEMSSNA